jgi:hypothetical protein
LSWTLRSVFEVKLFFLNKTRTWTEFLSVYIRCYLFWRLWKKCQVSVLALKRKHRGAGRPTCLRHSAEIRAETHLCFRIKCQFLLPGINHSRNFLIWTPQRRNSWISFQRHSSSCVQDNHGDSIDAFNQPYVTSSPNRIWTSNPVLVWHCTRLRQRGHCRRSYGTSILDVILLLLMISALFSFLPRLVFLSPCAFSLQSLCLNLAWGSQSGNYEDCYPYSSALKMEAVHSSATSVNYPTVRRHNSEDTTRPCQKFELRVTQRSCLSGCSVSPTSPASESPSSVWLGVPYHPLYHWASRPTKCLPRCAISPTSPLSESPNKMSAWVRHIAHFTIERVAQQSDWVRRTAHVTIERVT